jgi:hypothetical protein
VPQTLLDNAARGATTLLSSCQPSTTSSQLLDGTSPGDNTGDSAFNAGRKFKQWAADINAMFAILLGTTTAYSVSDTPGAGPIDDYSPSGLVLPGTKRLILTPSVACTINGMVATGVTDDYEICIYNASGTYAITFAHLAGGETTAANQFSNVNALPYVIPPLGRATARYITGSINKWTL